MATTATATPVVLSPTATSAMNVTPATPTTPATDQQKQKKRKSTSGASMNGSAKKTKTGEDQSGRYCHHCHRQRDSTVCCTLKVTTKKNKTERCGKTFWFVCFLPFAFVGVCLLLCERMCGICN
jgi:cytochrome c5